MKLYLYDEITKEYVEEVEAYIDPEETIVQGVPIYLHPPFSTDIKPPTLGKNQTCLFEEENWVIKSDYRGQKQCDEKFNISTVETIGDLEQGYVLITEEQANKIAEDKLYYIIVNGELVENPNYEEEQAEARKQDFLNQFFSLGEYGYFRKQPKGYGSAVESLNTAFNVVTILGKLPADTLTFYKEPDFNDAEQCTEEWLIANSFKNAEMTGTEFAQFYAQFMTSWNMQEHK